MTGGPAGLVERIPFRYKDLLKRRTSPYTQAIGAEITEINKLPAPFEEEGAQ
jgi:hypothetical protein